MIPLYSDQEFHLAKSRQKLPLQCEWCKSPFKRLKNQIQAAIGGSHANCSFCGYKCSSSYAHRNDGETKEVKCRNCNVSIRRKPSQIKRSKSKNFFCSKSCAAKYNNTHKKYGARRSKLEVWIEEQLTATYPKLEMHFNRKDAINSELDVYIPSLKLAFELNGIFHYEPIYGEEKLASIQNNDGRKFQACLEQGIELCLIDTSRQKYVKPKTSQKYLDIIISIINTK